MLEVKFEESKLHVLQNWKISTRAFIPKVKLFLIVARVW
jgi:hypothetical protein